MASLFSDARKRWIVIGEFVAAGLLVAGGVTLAVRRMAKPVAEIAPAPVVAATPAPPPDVPLPSAADSDAQVRAALSDLTPRSLFQTWLRADALLDRLVVTTVDIAEGRSPARELPFLRPHRRFRATGDGSRLIIARATYARWDAFANVISSLDDERVAAAYRTLHPLLESAYHALGYPGRPFDEVVARALKTVIDAPVREEVEVERAGSSYVYADPALESLGPVQKQLLRMGPRNTRLLQEQAADIASALGITLAHAPEASHVR
jgi:hypothetical protein